MPTPFMHLQFTETLRLQADERLLRKLDQAWPAFYLGSVAADFQTICDVPRAETHFYDLPPAPNDRAYPLMFAKHPELAEAAVLPPVQAVFVAAYVTHLLLDLIWFREILIPYFVEASDWGDFPQRLLAHHILLSYLDKLAFEDLPDSAASVLAAAQPDKWLPFATNDELIAWRDVLLEQMQPGAKLQTVTIYADRLKMSPDEFARKLQNAEWMERRVFDHVPVAEVQTRIDAAIPGCMDVVSEYLFRDRRATIDTDAAK